MNLLRVIILGVIQGLTEFLPVSSSAHLVLVPYLLHWEFLPLYFNVTLHLGTLLAVLIFFRSELLLIINSFFQPSEKDNFPRKLVILLIFATLPAVILGSVFEDFFSRLFEKPAYVSIFLLFTAFILFTSERFSKKIKEIKEMRLKDAVLIGLFQALAIIPGISRSGATIGMGLLRGYRREDAVKFSFLLSIPIIFGSFIFELKEANLNLTKENFSLLLLGFIFSFFAGYLAISFLLKYVKKKSLYLFSIYCLIVSLISFIYIYQGK